MVRLNWLKVNKFRNVQPGVHLKFHPRRNVLLGKNGTGKTTLLDLVAAAVSMNFTELENGDLDIEYELEFDEGRALLSVQNKAQELTLSRALAGLAAGLEEPHLKARAELTLTEAPRLEMEVARGRVSIWDEAARQSGNPFEKELVAVPAPGLLMGLGLLFRYRQTSPGNRGLPSLFSEMWLVRLDESLEYFSKTGKSKISATSSSDEGNQIVIPQYLPDLEGRLKEKLETHWDNKRHVFSQAETPFLDDFVRICEIREGEAIVDLMSSSEQDRSKSVELGNFRFLFTLPGGARISEQHLSYGQKRLLSFLCYLSRTKSVAVVDELVNGLHHSWIRTCIEKLGDRQVFLTSQNPLLLDYMTFESPEDVRSQFVLCRLNEDRTQMIWENMSEEASEDMYDSYKVGFQQVGELLQSKGLW